MNETLNDGLATNSAALNWLLLGEWLIAIGILAVAGGILWTVVQNRRILRAERTPNLILSDFEFTNAGGKGYTLSFKAVNLGRYPVFLRVLNYGTDTMHNTLSAPLDTLIPPSEAREVSHSFNFLTVVEGGDLGFEFQYGATGVETHRLAFPLSVNEQDIPVVRQRAQAN